MLCDIRDAYRYFFTTQKGCVVAIFFCVKLNDNKAVDTVSEHLEDDINKLQELTIKAHKVLSESFEGFLDGEKHQSLELVRMTEEIDHAFIVSDVSQLQLLCIEINMYGK